MKMNKKYIALIALFAALMIPLSCKKSFLTQTNTFSATAAATFNKSSDVIALVNSIYDTYQNSDFLKKSMWYYANFLTHDWFNNGNDIAWNNYTIPATFGALQTFWDDAYIGISRANQALPIIASAKARGIVTPALADRLTGETLFLRGMTYYYLTGTFGGVPLELSAQTNGLTPRSTQDQCFTQVVADMKQAESVLWTKAQIAAESPVPNADLGRATKGAAYAYEGSAQMWLRNYPAALTAFNNPELSNYHLLSNYVAVNEYNNQNNDESIYEVQFDLTGGNQSWGDSWNPPGAELGWIDSFSWPSEITGEGYDYGSPALYYSYQTGDTRKTLTILGPGDPNLSPGIIAKWGGIKGYPNVTGGYAAYEQSIVDYAAKKRNDLDTADYYRYTDASASLSSGNSNPLNTNGTLTHVWYGTDGTPRSGFCCSKKWRDPTLTGGSGPQAIFGSQNQTLMRYAEVLLSRAECKIRTGDVAGGLADIAQVRNRAFNGTAPAIWQDGQQVDGSAAPVLTDPMQKVLSEYRHELTGEYSLMYLLRRAGTDAGTGKLYDAEFLHNVNNPAGAGANNNSSAIIFAFGPTADGKSHGVTLNDIPTGRDILPIPQQAIGLNPNLKQNPGF